MDRSKDEPIGEPECDIDLLELAFRDSPYGLLYSDAVSGALTCNEAAERIFHVQPGKAIGRDFHDLVRLFVRLDGSPFPPDEDPVSVCLTTRNPVFGAVAGTPGGPGESPRWMRLDAVPRFRGGTGVLQGVLVWMNDVTGDVELGKAEKSSRDRFTSLFDHMSEGVALHEVVYDQSGRAIDYRIVGANPRYEFHVGIPREAAIGKLGSEVYGTSPAPYLEEFCGVAASGKEYYFETYFPPLDKHFRISVAPLGPGGFATIFFDISESKRVQCERERLLSELERKNRELESIVYVASHDLRSPLVNIQGFGARLERDSARLSSVVEAVARGDGDAVRRARELADEAIPRSLDFIRAGAAKIDRLIAGLLKLSRIGRMALVRRDLDMDAMFGEIVKAMSFQIESSGASVEIGSLPLCSGDPDQISQVFSNLLDNAIKYRSKDRKPAIVVTGRAKGRCSEYSVEDNGIGIPSGRLERVFDVFCRLDPDDGIEGEGLGLALVRQIVERHGGRITVESELGAGSRFIVLLPGKGVADEIYRCEDD